MKVSLSIHAIYGCNSLFIFIVFASCVVAGFAHLVSVHIINQNSEEIDKQNQYNEENDRCYKVCKENFSANGNEV